MKILIHIDTEEARALRFVIHWMAGQICEANPELSLVAVIDDTRRQVLASLARQGGYLGELVEDGQVIGSVSIEPTGDEQVRRSREDFGTITNLRPIS